nr:MAG TPA: hypothetical protein [Caudoviricetes sp.]
MLKLSYLLQDLEVSPYSIIKVIRRRAIKNDN